MKSLRYAFFVLGLSVFFSPAFADSKSLKVKVDCYSRDGAVDCQELVQSYFEKLSFATAVVSSADLTLTVRNLGSDGHTNRYSFKFEGAGDLPDFEIIDDIPDVLSQSWKVARVLGNMQKGTAPFLAIVEPGTTESGVFSLRMRNPKDDPMRNMRPMGSTHWYLSLSGNFNYTKTQNTASSGGLSADSNYSDKSWRFANQVKANYQKVVVLVDGEKQVEEVTSFGAKTIVVRSISKGWSVAAFGIVSHDKSANYDHSELGAVGIEWDLVPFLQSNDRNVGIRYFAGAKHSNFIKPNVQDKLAINYITHGIDAYFTWHFQKLDLNAYVFGQSVADDMRFAGVGAELNLSYRLTRSLSANISGWGDLQRSVINAPKEELSGDGLEQYLNGGKFGKKNMGTYFTLTYTFGNSVLQRQDQRWTR